MYQIPIDSGLQYIPNAISTDLSQQVQDEIEKLLEGKMINGQRRTNRYGSKVFGSFGPYEREPLLPIFTQLLNTIQSQCQNINNNNNISSMNYNQVEILKLSAGTKYFFDIDKEQETNGPQLFININGTNPITFYNNQHGQYIETTLSNSININTNTNDQNENTTSTSTHSTSTSTPFISKTTSVLIAPQENSCLILPEQFVHNYTKQIKAQSYKTKVLPIDLQLLPSSTTPSTTTTIPSTTTTTPTTTTATDTPSLNTTTTSTSLIYDYSLLLYHAKQKHIEKKTKRLQWLQSQLDSGKITLDEFNTIVKKDSMKDSSIEAEFADNDDNNITNQNNSTTTISTDSIVTTNTTEQTNTTTTTQQPSQQQQPQQMNPTTEYLLSQPTIPYKRVNSYAIIFRSFVKHIPLLTENEYTTITDDNTNQQSTTSSTDNQHHLHISERQRKQLIEKQQRSNKIVPTITINLEELTDAQLSEFEKKHVHEVYDNIADHFSGTRYQAWPQVDEFVSSLPKNTLLADIGCGNGKYLSINPNIITIGCDISFNLLQLATQRGCQVCVGDSLSIPFRSHYFDTTISIAVLHHISSKKRRIDAINEMLRITKINGKILITVWAKEQDGSGGRVFTQGDVWVPFKTATSVENELQLQKIKRQNDLVEYNKLHRKELLNTTNNNDTTATTNDTAANTNNTTTNNNEQKEPQQQQSQPESTPTTTTPTTTTQTTSNLDVQLPENVSETSTRFYHVFCQGEMEELLNDKLILYPLSIDKIFYGKGNWCAIFTRL